MAEPNLIRGLTPGALNGDKPKSYGKGRRCACGTKIMQYRKGSQCGLCEIDPERAARVLEQKETGVGMFGIKWKSKEYPDGCIECPEGERFLRRHVSRGLCSLHYQRAKKAESASADAEKVTVRLRTVVDTGVDVPATDAELDAGVATRTLDADDVDPEGGDLYYPGGGIGPTPIVLPASDTEPRLCCGAKDDPTDDCGGPECAYADDISDSDEPSCDGPTEADEPHFVTLQGYGLPIYEMDAEVRAMERLLSALLTLDRDAQVRAVRWVTARVGIDRPLPASEE